MSETAIVILNWNGKSFLERFLPSVISFTPSDQAEIIIADNGSTDDSLEYMNITWPTIRIIKLDKNYGFADGYNKALRQLTRFSYFVLLNSDIEVTENWLTPLILCLKSNPKYAACMPKMRSFLQKSNFEYAGAAGGFMDYLGYPFCQGRIFDSLEEDKGQYDQPKEVFWATGACLAIRSELFFRAGGFDADFFAHQEEIDLCWRLQNAGFKILYIPGSTVFHLGGGTLPKENPHKTYLNFRNNLLLLYKNLPREKVFQVLFLRRILDLISAIRFALRADFGNAFAIWKAHQGYYAQLKKYRSSGVELQRPPLKLDLPGVYKRSIVWDFFVLRRKQFTKLRF